MQGPRKHALAGAVLAAEEHRRVGLRGPGQHVHHRAHRGRGRGKQHVRRLRAELAFQVGGTPGQRALLEHAIQGMPDLCWGERFGQVVPSPTAHGLDRGFDRRVGGDHHDGQIWILGQQPWDEVEAALRAELQIQEGHVEARPPHDLDGGLRRRSFAHFSAQGFDTHAQGVPDVLLVVYDEDVERIHEGILAHRRPAVAPSPGFMPTVQVAIP